MWMIALLLIGVVCYYYFSGMYQGPWNFQDVLQRFKKGGGNKSTSSGKLFTSASEEANLRSYVQNALNKGVAKGTIVDTLLNRGWTKQQIDAIMRQIP